MSFDISAVLFVADQNKYAQYRTEIAPLLEATGGASDMTSRYPKF